MAKANAGETEVTREIPALSMRAAIRPGSIDLEKRTIEVVWTTGARVLRGFWDKFYEELSLDPAHVRMGRLNNGAPLLDSHRVGDLSAVLGVVESARLEKGQGVAVVRFSKAEDDPEADAVFRKVKDGIIQNISVGYRTFKMEKVEGGDAEIPVFRATDWEPFELSAVTAGADDGAGFRSIHSQLTNPCQILTYQERSMSKPNTDGGSTPAAPAVAAPVPAPQSISADDATRIAETAARAELERGTVIRSLVTRHQLGDELATRLISERVSVEAARAAILDALATRSEAQPPSANSQHRAVEGGEDARDKFQRGALAWIFQRAMMADTVRQAQKADKFGEHFRGLEFDAGEFRGMKFSDMARASLELRGISTKGLHGERLFEKALSRAFNTTGDFPVLLESAMHKTMLAAYATQPFTWRRFCGVKPVQDFRTATFYRNGSFGTLDTVNEHGEFKQKAIPDGEKATISVSTKGNIIGITRQALVNDDLGAFNDLAARWGSSAARSIEVDVYALLALNSGLGPTQADSQPLFHANRNNIGATGAITATTLSSMRQKMRAQKDPSGNDFLDLQPAVLLVPPGIEDAAKILNGDAFDPAQAGQKTNPVRGLFRDIVVSPRLTASTTRHYAFADPGTAPVIVVSFLDGQEAPEMRSEEGFEIDGIKWRVRLDYGVQVVDYRGSATCAGA